MIAMRRILTRLSSKPARITLSAILLATAAGLLLWDSDIMLALSLRLNRHDRPTYKTRLQPHKKPLRRRIRGNRLVADSASIDVRLYGGRRSSKGLKKGAWIDPHGGTPGSGEPIIVAGHRTTRHFATLHLLRRRDPVIVYWKGHEYDYVVKKTRSVSGRRRLNVQKIAGTGERLVMYTCTKKRRGRKRKVVVAVPYKKRKRR